MSDLTGYAAEIEATLAAERPPMVTQTLIFEKKKFTRDEAVAWAKKNDFKSDKVDETEDSYRLRQRDPGDFDPKSFRTIPFKDGVQAVVGHLKGAKASADAGSSALRIPSEADLRALFESQFLCVSEAFLSGSPLAWIETRAARMLSGSAPEGAKPYSVEGDKAIIEIKGPLLQQGGWLFDGHADIARRIDMAAKDPTVARIGLDIDSPGGVVAGCFDAVRASRSAIQASGKDCDAWCGGNGAFSAGYAHAAGIANSISVSDSSGVGSIGVMSVMPDITGALEKEGIRYDVIRSGNRKAEGSPLIANTDASRARRQAHVDDMAGIFAGIVASARGMRKGTILDQQGAEFYGVKAVREGLADRVESRAEWLARGAEKRPTMVQVPGPVPGTAGPVVPRAETVRTGAGASKMSMSIVAIAVGLAPEATEDQVAMKIMTMRSEREALSQAVDQARAEAAKAHSDAVSARAELETIKARALKAESDLSTAVTAALDYVKSETQLAGKRTTADIDADYASWSKLGEVDRLTTAVDRYKNIPRGAALQRQETREVEPANIGGSGAAIDPSRLDGAKMTGTQVTAYIGTEHGERLLAEYNNAKRKQDADMFGGTLK